MQPTRRPTPRGVAAVLAACTLVTAAPALAAQTPQLPLNPKSIPQFVERLPQLNLDPQTFGLGITTIVTNNATTPLQLSICEFDSKVLPSTLVLPNGARYASTRTWGYIPGAACPSATQDTYLGPVLVNTRGTPTMVRYTNSLPTVRDTQVLAYKYSTDQTLHWADPLGGEMNGCHMNGGVPAFKSACSLNFGEWWDPLLNQGGFNPVGIPAVPHLHGGEVPPVIDGGPDAWFTSVGGMQGHDYYTWVPPALSPIPPAASNEAIYVYPNAQEAAPLWFHDHTLGATRLNVYAGIAGGYYLLDPAQEAYLASINFLPVDQVIPLILQDRMFDTNGQLYFPNDTSGGVLSALNPEHPYWVPEFIGDTIVVNGKAWPFLEVQARRYRFLFLNGSNARTYELFFQNPVTSVMGPTLWAVGNDGGFLDLPAKIDPNAPPPGERRLVIQPGERYEMIIDFGAYANQTLLLRNVAKAPYPGGANPQFATTGRVIQVRVGPALGTPDASYNPAALPAPLPLRATPMVRLASAGALAAGVPIAATRALTLNEVMGMRVKAIDPVTGLATTYPGGPLEILVNNTMWSGNSPRTFNDFVAVAPVATGPVELVSETPAEGTTEIWEIINTTADAHPIHTHLATFQIVNRQAYDAKGYLGAYGLLFPAVTGSATCIGGVFCPGFGPPYAYNDLTPAKTGGKFGGNPDVTPYLRGAPLPPDGDEVGWKDTVMAPPATVTRFAVRFAPQGVAANTAGVGYPFSPNDGFDPVTLLPNGNLANTHGYVWHCHIIDHEDNEMMRPDVIVPIPLAPRTFVKGVDF